MIIVLGGCRSDEKTEPEEVRKISYSVEVRPVLVEKCSQCHNNLPFHDPGSIDLKYRHLDPAIEIPGLVYDWQEQGGIVDEHWALGAIKSSGSKQLEDFFPDLENRSPVLRESPDPIFDEELVDLLAGDFLEGERAVATKFLRQGDDHPEFRTQMVGHTFLGLRMECAKCHDHPSDPVMKDDFDRVREIFTNPVDEEVLPHGLRPPLEIVGSQSLTTQRDELLKMLGNLESAPKFSESGYETWLGEEGRIPQVRDLLAAFSFNEKEFVNLVPTSDELLIEGGGVGFGPGVQGEGLVCEDQNELSISGLRISDELDQFTFSAWIRTDNQTPGDLSILRIGPPGRGFEFLAVDGKLQARWLRAWPQIGISQTSSDQLVFPGRWMQVAVSWDGSRLAEGIKIFLNGSRVETLGEGELIKAVLPDGGALTLGSEGLLLDELQVFGDVLTEVEVAQLFDGRSLLQAFQSRGDLREFYSKRVLALDGSRQAKVRSINRELMQLESEFQEFPVMKHRENQLPTTESWLESFEAKDRLEFSRRLNSNLVARSLANEVWRRHFGAPLVRGLGHGDPMPENRELLEFLAAQIAKNNNQPEALGLLIRESEIWRREVEVTLMPDPVCPREDSTSEN